MTAPMTAEEAFRRVCGQSSPWVAADYATAIDWAQTLGDFAPLENVMLNNPPPAEAVPALEDVLSRRPALRRREKQPQNARLFSVGQAAAIRRMFGLLVESGLLDKTATIELAQFFRVSPEAIRDVVKRRNSYKFDP